MANRMASSFHEMEIPELSMSYLAKLVACPICSEIPSTSIFQCQTGHIVCVPCRRKFDSCLTCMSPWINTKNFLAQELAKLIKNNCKYAKFGCAQENMSGEERKSHHLECKFRPITCQLPLASTDTPCGKEVKVENYSQHILEDHDGKSLAKSPGHISTHEVVQSIPGELTKMSKLPCKDLPPVLHLRNNGKDFLLVTSSYNTVTPCWYLVVVESQIAKGEDKAVQHWATIIIQHPVSKVELSLKAPANSIRDSGEEIKNSGVCLLVNKKTLNAVSFYNPITECTEWNLVVSFQNKDEVCAPSASVQQIQSNRSDSFAQIGNTVRSAPSSESKNTNVPLMLQELDWPFCGDSTKEIYIAVRTNFSTKKGGGVCIITGHDKPTLYSTSQIILEDSLQDISFADLEARNAIKVISTFKTLFTSGSNVYVSCPVDIYTAGPPGSHTRVFGEQLMNIAKSRGNLSISSLIYDKSRIENIAVIALLNSKESCNRVLQKEMASEIILPLPLTTPTKSEIPSEVQTTAVTSKEVLNNPSPSTLSAVSSVSIPISEAVKDDNIKASEVSGILDESGTRVPMFQHSESPDGDGAINVAISANPVSKVGGGVCIIRLKDEDPVYSTRLVSLADSSAVSSVELEAHAAMKTIQHFKKFFKHNVKINVSSPTDISSIGPLGSYTYLLDAQLKQIEKNRGELYLKFLNFDENRLENIAVASLLTSVSSCKVVLEKAGIRDISVPMPKKMKHQPAVKAEIRNIGEIPFTSTEGLDNSRSESVASSVTLPDSDVEVAEDEFIKTKRNRKSRKDEISSPPKMADEIQTNSLAETNGMVEGSPDSPVLPNDAVAVKETLEDKPESAKQLSPPLNGQDLVISIAVRTNFNTRTGGGVCIIRSSDQDPLYFTCQSSLLRSNASNIVELEAHNAANVISRSRFKKFLRPENNIQFSCPVPIFSISSNPDGSFMQLFKHRLGLIEKAHGKLNITFMEFDQHRIENKAVAALLVSVASCEHVLHKAGISGVSIPSTTPPAQENGQELPDMSTDALVQSIPEAGTKPAAEQPENGMKTQRMPSTSSDILDGQSSTSSSFKSGPRVEVSTHTEMPHQISATASPSSDLKQIVRIAVRTDLKTKTGGGVCIIHLKDQEPLYSTCRSSLATPNAGNIVELEAQNAAKVISPSRFKKFFIPENNIQFSCPVNIYSNSSDGSFRQVFQHGLKQIEEEHGELNFTFLKYDENLLENIAVASLLVSEASCKNVLEKAGIRAMSTATKPMGQEGKCPVPTKVETNKMSAPNTTTKEPVPTVLPKTSTVIQKTQQTQMEAPKSSESAHARISVAKSDSQLSPKESVEATPVVAVVPPFRSDPAHVINIALREDFGDWKSGFSVCVVHAKGKPPGYSICLLEDAKVESDVEYEALNAIEAISSFKKFFTPGSCINFSSNLDISKVGKSGSNTELLYKKLEELKESLGSLEVHFNTEYDRTSIENVAADALIISPDNCKKKFKEAGIIELEKKK